MKAINIGRSIDIMKAKAGVKMADICKGTGLSRATISLMRRNSSVGSMASLIKVAYFFELGVVEFLTEGLVGKDLIFDKGKDDARSIKHDSDS